MKLTLRSRAVAGALALSTAVLCAAVLCAALLCAEPANATGAVPAASYTVPAASYTFRTLDNAKGRSFNQLLGINNHGKVAGYYGSGAAGHPNRGYLLAPPYGPASYHAENVPGAAQTQVTGLNSAGVSVGFYSPTNKANAAANANVGFWERGGRVRKVAFPARKAPDGKQARRASLEQASTARTRSWASSTRQRGWSRRSTSPRAPRPRCISSPSLAPT